MITSKGFIGINMVVSMFIMMKIIIVGTIFELPVYIMGTPGLQFKPYVPWRATHILPRGVSAIRVEVFSIIFRTVFDP